LLQSISRDLASARKEIEQLKTGRDTMARDNANLSEQRKASQEQLIRTVARLSDQLKAS
jgi:cell division protein FtsB